MTTSKPSQNNIDRRPEFRPLADRLRPASLKEMIGQDKVIGKGKFVNELLARHEATSLIFWGPPGCGKTTLARIIANSGNYHFIEISAVTAGKADVLRVIEDAKAMQRLGTRTILFVDEIHRFNKAQQDAFLPHIENGTLILIGATTENPSFEVIAPLLSRSRVIVLEGLSQTELVTILKRATKTYPQLKVELKALHTLAEFAAGDARAALNGLEAAVQVSPTQLSVTAVKQAMQQVNLAYDKTGDFHYNLISAFIKSIRGSHVDAALYYLFRMLEAGEDPKFIARRLIIFASEDIGMAASAALNLATSCFLAVERVGLPECEYHLAHTTIALAKSPKSRAVADAMARAKQAVRATPTAQVPLDLRNAPTKLMKDLGYGKNYQWIADFKAPEGFLPPELGQEQFYFDDN
ncbi:MAG: replication-associated recombination protein A [bacterium]